MGRESITEEDVRELPFPGAVDARDGDLRRCLEAPDSERHLCHGAVKRDPADSPLTLGDLFDCPAARRDAEEMSGAADAAREVDEFAVGAPEWCNCNRPSWIHKRQIARQLKNRHRAA